MPEMLLGELCHGEPFDRAAVEAARPQDYTPPVARLDSLILNAEAFHAWTTHHFGIATRLDAEIAIGDVMPLDGLAFIGGQPYRIPAACYTCRLR